MLAVSSLVDNFSMGFDNFPDFCDGNLPDSIDFDDLFVGVDDGDMFPEILAEFTLSSGEDADVKDGNGKDSGSISGLNSSPSPSEEIVSKREEAIVFNPSDKNKKSKNNFHGKRKMKVDWTPELHRRFVQAVEQLGVDKAVPSRILELMGIECLTRHNIASHLQKYRSHRKHLRAREAEAASWTQRRQMYGGGRGNGGGGKRDMVNPWLAPTMGFPPAMAPPLHHHFQPLHVWGHPTLDQSVVHMGPKHLPHFLSPTPPLPWSPAGPHLNHQPRFHSHALYKVESHGSNLAAPPQPPLDFHHYKESVDAAIGDVLSKPWLPLPLGLKPPSLDGVMAELQRHGIQKILPSSSPS